ncbi:putative DeoR family transcriptional regulator, stage III sporulation protein D [Anaerobranca californiensis DSM 14826]|uniref:Putative DeoR family transcriptional regulator, stage III sporulation protein D n=1 Tax=Anaerobranca californiensis DSM 14826 TaxID=1120989 RepID=A0A1M6MBU1_9FIRM|nr:sporulation transcriptional regulator SpoIIID [Anaerobranca californiensis]SHJ80895.1 putative DeoR family transcriptional regulator, stage III sporulation protein D [Anaerobranca californiensis DSM 14826]
MNDYIIQRVLEITHYILKTEETVRGISKKFGVSKSTVHKDLVERLPLINKELYGQVKEILEKNKSVRHIRGGESTKLKYMKKELVSE